MKLFLTLAAGLLLAPPAVRGQLLQPDSLTIDNNIISVSYDSSQGTFTASRGARVFLKQGRFEEAGGNATARRVEIRDAVGAGKGIQLTFSSGYTYTIALYENTPFVCIKSSIHNRTDKPLVVDAVSPVRFCR